MTNDELMEVPYRKVMRTEFVRSVKWIPRDVSEQEAVFLKNDSTQVAEIWIVETILTVKRPLISGGGVTYRYGVESVLEVFVTDCDTNRAMVYHGNCIWYDGVKAMQEVHQTWLTHIGKNF